MSKRTPTDDALRLFKQVARLRYSNELISPDRREKASDHFDHMLNAIVAAAEQRGAERGWDEAIDYAWDDSSIYQADAARAKSKNPYRADQIEQENNVG